MKKINVVSGKGGTGKTLITSVLAELITKQKSLKVLLIDVDVFVRGLTTLLYFDSNRKTHLIDDNQCSVADILSARGRSEPHLQAGVHKYHSFDVWPAVRRINETLDCHDLMPETFEHAKVRLERLFQIAKKEYDLIFLDCRAGFDELVAAAHAVCDISINVEEDDLVSTITSDNLTEQLRITSAKKILYRIINKSRQKHRERTVDLGVIPFDADIMASYGEAEFWSSITKSLIEPSLVTIWNELCRRENLESWKLESFRRSPLPLPATEKYFARLTLVQRLASVYGVLFVILGLAAMVMGRKGWLEFLSDPIRLSGLVIGILGVSLAGLSFSNLLPRR